MDVNGKRLRERNMEEKRESGRKKTKTERERKTQEKDKNQHNSFPLISSTYNIKAITGCLCQRVWNNTLVSGGKMR